MALGFANWCSLLTAAVVLSGCVMPNLYTTPRATPVGRFSFAATPQWVQPAGGEPRPATQLGVRVGVYQRLDLGFRTNFHNVAGDFKWNVLRTNAFDLALDAGAEYGNNSVEPWSSTTYLHFPILMGVNVADGVTLLPSTGLSWGLGDQPDLNPPVFDVDIDPNPSPPPSPRAGGAFLRAGIGIQIRSSWRFAVQPEFLYMRLVEPSPGTHSFYCAGLTFIWGRNPY